MADRKITLNKTFTVDLAGDSIWDKERTINPKSVEVTGITLRESDYGDGDVYWDATITHDGPWEIYTDTGFVKGIMELLGPGWEVDFSEQGMQQDGLAHFDIHDHPYEIKNPLELEAN